jgi:hypothetical protein
VRIETNEPVKVAKRAMWLAWQACGGPIGMGVFQDNPGATEEAVWNNVSVRGDYAYAPEPGVKEKDGKGEAYADYTFGRMMKLRLRWDAEGIEVSEAVRTTNLGASVTRATKV